MIQNPYAPPAAELAEPDALSGQEAPFYVVAPRKFMALFFATLGIYSLYWFYRNWAQVRCQGENVWPWPRAIFQVFFVHDLFRRVSRHAERQGVDLDWQHGGHATLMVILIIVGNVLDRLSMAGIEALVVGLLSCAILMPMGLAFKRAQHYINLASGDAEGAANAGFSTANIVWIVVGLCLWVLYLASLFTE